MAEKQTPKGLVVGLIEENPPKQEEKPQVKTTRKPREKD